MSACLRSIYPSTVDTMARHIARFVGREECMTSHSLCVLRIKCVIAEELAAARAAAGDASVEYDEPVDLAGYDRAFELLEGGAASA